MGRDSYRVADLVEAFWISQGVDHKVSRVNGSGGTIRDNYSSTGGNRTTLANYMEQIGWDAKGAIPGATPTAIVMDNSGAGASSAGGAAAQTPNPYLKTFSKQKPTPTCPLPLTPTSSSPLTRNSEAPPLPLICVTPSPTPNLRNPYPYP